MKDIYFDTLIWEEDGVYVSYSPQLDVSSCGDTVEDARRMLREAVRLFLEEAERKGTLQDILMDQKRSKLEKRIAEAREAYKKGEVQRGTVADLMKVLDE